MRVRSFFLGVPPSLISRLALVCVAALAGVSAVRAGGRAQTALHRRRGRTSLLDPPSRKAGLPCLESESATG